MRMSLRGNCPWCPSKKCLSYSCSMLQPSFFTTQQLESRSKRDGKAVETLWLPDPKKFRISIFRFSWYLMISMIINAINVPVELGDGSTVTIEIFLLFPSIGFPNNNFRDSMESLRPFPGYTTWAWGWSLILSFDIIWRYQMMISDYHLGVSMNYTLAGGLKWMI